MVAEKHTGKHGMIIVQKCRGVIVMKIGEGKDLHVRLEQGKKTLIISWLNGNSNKRLNNK